MEKFLTKCFIEQTSKKDMIYNSTKSLSFETIPKRLYSYQELITEADENNNITIYNKTAPGGLFFSRTTSQHISDIIFFLTKNKIEYDLVDFLE